MGLFQRRPRTLVPASTLGSLGAYGEAVLSARRAGQPLNDSRFDWATFLGPVHMIMMSGDRNRVIEEVYEAATADTERDLAMVGGYRLLVEFSAELEDERFLRLYDRSLEYMRMLEFSSGHLTGHEARRWVATHGELRESFDGIFEVAVPATGDVPDPKPLDLGESRMVALTAPLPDGNAIIAEHRAAGNYACFIEGPWSSDDPRRVRDERPFVGPCGTLPELLRALGQQLGTPPHWSDQDLEPYFPRRRAR